jgi:predicted O-methyltransferase YrrM
MCNKFNNKELETVKQKALENHIPILMDDTLEKIEEILKQEKPKRILEIGTAVGYSASMFAKFTEEECIIDTIEIDEERAKEAKENIKKIGVENRINIMIGNAVEILPTLNETYDIVFIDAAKGKYPIFLQEGIRMIKNNGLILADNILYKGYVMSDYNAHKQRTAVRHLREYIKEITENEKCESEILDIGDGLSITRVRK